jgi:hypothetical protein
LIVTLENAGEPGRDTEARGAGRTGGAGREERL